MTSTKRFCLPSVDDGVEENEPNQRQTSSKHKRTIFELSSSPLHLYLLLVALFGTRNEELSEAWIHEIRKLSLPKYGAQAYAETATCCIMKCREKVERATYATDSEDFVFLLPTCKKHSDAEKLYRLYNEFRLKGGSIYLAMKLRSKEKSAFRFEGRGKCWYEETRTPEYRLKDAIIKDRIDVDLATECDE